MEIIYRHFEVLPSTNDWAKENLATFGREALTIVSADSQTAGRGRFERKWVSPAGKNIYASFCFFQENPDPFATTRLLADVTISVLQVYGIHSSIKWPNDLQVNQKKIAGILCETVGDGVVIGLGLNVNMEQDELEKIDQPATSMLAETGKQIDIQQLLEKLTTSFSHKLTGYAGSSSLGVDGRIEKPPSCPPKGGSWSE